MKYKVNHVVRLVECQATVRQVTPQSGRDYIELALKEMPHRDYNGTGKWTVNAVQARYKEYASRLSVETPLPLIPKELVQGGTRWTYPIMYSVIEGIKAGDAACVVIGVEFIEEDKRFPFGANLKARTARALRLSVLPQSLILRIRRRIVDMLQVGNTPREYRDYVRLLRKVGFSDLWPKIEENAPRSNKYAMRYFSYLRDVHERSPSVVPR